MIAKLVHSKDLKLAQEFKSMCDEYGITCEIYDSTYTKEKKKGFKVKGSFSSRLDPFIGIYNDNGVPIKGFYTEACECNIKNFKEFVNKNA